MSTLNTTTVATRPTTLNNTTDVGKSYFETDTNNIIVWDGTNWRGYQNDGVTFSGTSYVAELNGTNQYLTLGDVSGTLGGANKCSVSWWMKQPTISPLSYRRIWQMGEGYDNLAVFWNYNSGNQTQYWIFFVGTGSGSYQTVRTSGSSTIDDNQWHLWTLVYDGTQSGDAGKFSFYKDTTSLSVVDDGGGTIAASLPSGTGDEPHIGAYYNTTVSQFSDASFDDFAIFDDVLTSTQVANIYNNQIYPSSLQHLYRLENNVDDSVGTADGTQVNSPITSSPSSPQFPY
jgi:hypothetical protein